MTATDSLQPRVLVVHDDQSDTESHALVALRRAGFMVQLARNGREALERVGIDTFAAVVIDLKLGDTDGTTLYRELCVIDDELERRCIFVTEGYIGHDQRRFVTIHGRRVLGRPVPGPVLIAAVREVVGTK